ncbi:YdcF family protein [Chitinophagaceae bacterium MMS25-I14]
MILPGCVILGEHAGRAYKNAEAQKPFDAIIVPGIPYNSNHWGHLMKSRVLWSVTLYRNGIAKNIIYSGGAVYSPYKEAFIMGRYAMQLGVPPEHIYYDTIATHSTENIYYSCIVASQNKFSRLALATDRGQAYYLKKFIRRRFCNIITRIPVVRDSLRSYKTINPEIETASLLEKNFTSLKKLRCRSDRRKGAKGENIYWEQYPRGKITSITIIQDMPLQNISIPSLMAIPAPSSL